jgi:hypothetical protein
VYFEQLGKQSHSALMIDDDQCEAEECFQSDQLCICSIFKDSLGVGSFFIPFSWFGPPAVLKPLLLPSNYIVEGLIEYPTFGYAPKSILIKHHIH